MRPKLSAPLTRALLLTLGVLVGGSSGFGTRSAMAADDLGKEMAKLSQKIKLLLDQKGMDSIAVGDFTAPAKLAASAGPSIAKCLSDELNKMGVTVKRRSDLEVNGRYHDVNGGDANQLGIQIKAHIVDSSGDEILTLEPRAVFDLTTIASLAGLTVSMPTEATTKERNDAITDAVDTPSVQIANTRISAASDSPYAIEIQVKAGSDYRPRAATKDSDGLAFMKIARKEIYAVKLINDSKRDAAVTLTIDGLNVFAFSENKNYTHYIVPAGQALVVPGWHRNNSVSDSFLITEYAKSAAAEGLNTAASIGTITAAFAAAWPRGESPPDDEPLGGKGGPGGDATGKGPPVDFKLVEIVREVGKLRASVSVRYNKGADPGDLPGNPP